LNQLDLSDIKDKDFTKLHSFIKNPKLIKIEDLII